MNKRQPVYPDCYGHLHDPVSEQCGCCLLRDPCSAVVAPTSKVTRAKLTEEDVPSSKKELILAICRKYGISTKYSTKDGRVVDVTTCLSEITNLDFIMTTKEALTKILLG